MVTGGGDGRTDPYLVTVVGTKANPNVTIVPDTPTRGRWDCTVLLCAIRITPTEFLTLVAFLDLLPRFLVGWKFKRQLLVIHLSKSGETGRGSRHVDVYTFPTTPTGLLVFSNVRTPKTEKFFSLRSGDGIWQHFDNFMGPTVTTTTIKVIIWQSSFQQKKFSSVVEDIESTSFSFTRVPEWCVYRAIYSSFVSPKRIVASWWSCSRCWRKFRKCFWSLMPVSTETKVPGKQPMPNEDRVRRACFYAYGFLCMFVRAPVCFCFFWMFVMLVCVRCFLAWVVFCGPQ